jgi:hypothetical protein
LSHAAQAAEAIVALINSRLTTPRLDAGRWTGVEAGFIQHCAAGGDTAGRVRTTHPHSARGPNMIRGRSRPNYIIRKQTRGPRRSCRHRLTAAVPLPSPALAAPPTQC